jgi:hypothetical protein
MRRGEASLKDRTHLMTIIEGLVQETATQDCTILAYRAPSSPRTSNISASLLHDINEPRRLGRQSEPTPVSAVLIPLIHTPLPGSLYLKIIQANVTFFTMIVHIDSLVSMLPPLNAFIFAATA